MAKVHCFVVKYGIKDSHLHDEEVGIVDVELHRMEEILDFVLLRNVAVDEVLVAPADGDLHRNAWSMLLLLHAPIRRRPERKCDGPRGEERSCFFAIISFPVQQCKTGAGCNLAGNSDLVVCLVANRAGLLIIVVEDDRDRCLLDTSLALLVDELLQRTGTDLPQSNNREEASSHVPDPIQLDCAP